MKRKPIYYPDAWLVRSNVEAFGIQEGIKIMTARYQIPFGYMYFCIFGRYPTR